MGLRLRRIGYAPPVVVEEEPEAMIFIESTLEEPTKLTIIKRINAWGERVNAMASEWWRALWDLD